MFGRAFVGFFCCWLVDRLLFFKKYLVGFFSLDNGSSKEEENKDSEKQKKVFVDI